MIVYNCFVFQIKADIILAPMHRTVKLLAENTDQPIYFYLFSYQGQHSFVMWNDTTPYGIFFCSYLQIEIIPCTHKYNLYLFSE